MTRFRIALIAVALLAVTGCYASVRVPDGHPSSSQHDQRGDKDGHAQANHGNDRDHD